jgi:hypothetical protein
VSSPKDGRTEEQAETKDQIRSDSVLCGGENEASKLLETEGRGGIAEARLKKAL